MYTDVLANADNYITLLKESAEGAADPVVKNKYVGFIAVTAVTFFEEAFKDILRDFSNKKHPILGNYVRIQYEKLNGRITIGDIKKEHIPKFGEKYAKRFEKLLNSTEDKNLREGRGSIKSSYGNIITWRHGFVHGGAIPINATYEESIRCYTLGKEVIHCVGLALRR